MGKRVNTADPLLDRPGYRRLGGTKGGRIKLTEFDAYVVRCAHCVMVGLVEIHDRDYRDAQGRARRMHKRHACTPDQPPTTIPNPSTLAQRHHALGRGDNRTGKGGRTD